MTLRSTPRSAQHNPFRTTRLESLRFRGGAEGLSVGGSGNDCEPEVSQNQVIGSDVIYQRLHAMGKRGAIVGPEGAGKTALLAELAEHFEHDGFIVLSVKLNYKQRWLSRPQRAAITALGRNKTALIIDSAEQLGPLAWRWARRLARPFGPMVIATHEPGRLPTIYSCQTNMQLMMELTTELLNRKLTQQEMDAAREAFINHQGNIRHAFLELYDVAAAGTMFHEQLDD